MSLCLTFHFANGKEQTTSIKHREKDIALCGSKLLHGEKKIVSGELVLQRSILAELRDEKLYLSTFHDGKRSFDACDDFKLEEFTQLKLLCSNLEQAKKQRLENHSLEGRTQGHKM